MANPRDWRKTEPSLAKAAIFDSFALTFLRPSAISPRDFLPRPQPGGVTAEKRPKVPRRGVSLPHRATARPETRP